jgi:hypothetical protein
MVRRGSTVRVRQRASTKFLLISLSVCPRRELSWRRRPPSVHGPVRVALARRGNAYTRVRGRRRSGACLVAAYPPATIGTFLDDLLAKENEAAAA